MENNQRLAIILSMAVVTAWLIWENNRIEDTQAEHAALDASRQDQIEEPLIDGGYDASRYRDAE